MMMANNALFYFWSVILVVWHWSLDEQPGGNLEAIGKQSGTIWRQSGAKGAQERPRGNLRGQSWV
jgi:hypothetical protein